jgi:DNA-binding NarL/FixJ family response regulator
MGLRVLIVDDNPDFRRLARRALEADGYEVVGTAPDANLGLAAARELSPEVVLLDVDLPDARGFDVAAQLARERPSAALLLTSTCDRQDFEQLALQSGACGFLPKDDLSGPALERVLAWRPLPQTGWPVA